MPGIPINTDAILDIITISRHLQNNKIKFASPELHLFAYLACLLWVYDSHPAADWGYSVVGTEVGAPFSIETEQAISFLTGSGCLLEREASFYLTPRAEEAGKLFGSMTINEDRTRSLDAACSTVNSLPIGMVLSALGHEPDLLRSQNTPSARRLLEDLALRKLYQHFTILKTSIGSESKDLRSPAYIWLTALQRASELAGI